MMRQALGLYANIRPVQSWPEVSPRDDVNMIIVRENTEGLYSGIERSDGQTAVAERVITRQASGRIAERAVELARTLDRRRLTIVHKANILPLSDGLFRDSPAGTSSALPDVGQLPDPDVAETDRVTVILEPKRQLVRMRLVWRPIHPCRRAR